MIVTMERSGTTEIICRLNMHETPPVGHTIHMVPSGHPLKANNATRKFRVEHVMHVVSEDSIGDYVEHEAIIIVTEW